MSVDSLAPPILVDDKDSLDRFVQALAPHPVVAVDTESNSLHAYRECVCLIQFSIPGADYIVDPISIDGLEPLAPFFANLSQQKVFHAAEYDIICLKRDFHFEFRNIFDTMSAARTLGWPQFGLAKILDTRFGVKHNKKYQRSDWKRRPLEPGQVDYARLDTHYLMALRDQQLQELTESGHLSEAQEDFTRLEQLSGKENHPTSDPMAFWRVKRSRDLSPGQAAVLKSLYEYREKQAAKMDHPPFKIMAEATLMALVQRAPALPEDLQGLHGMTSRQIHRHGHGVLHAIQEGLQAPPQFPPRRNSVSDEVLDRYNRLHTWRKNRARARGVESDVILPPTALRDLAHHPPLNQSELAQITDLGPWRRKTYGKEILELL